MHQAFKILPVNMVPSATDFFAEISSGSLSYFYQDHENKLINGLSVFNFEQTNDEYTLANTLENILDKEELVEDHFHEVFISYAFSESILTPEKYYSINKNKDDLDVVYGDLYQGTVLTDYIEEKKLYNTYRIPVRIHQKLTSRFAKATYIHQYSLLLKQLGSTGNLLKIIFYQNKIVVLLQREGKLQIIQSFRYQTADDVLYHMLNVCRQFTVSEADVQLCGMIEKDSVIYRQIEKYFMNITFPGLLKELSYADEIKTFPTHFFGHLFAFATCV